jgi:hypothetical protein
MCYSSLQGDFFVLFFSTSLGFGLEKYTGLFTQITEITYGREEEGGGGGFETATG